MTNVRIPCYYKVAKSNKKTTIINIESVMIMMKTIVVKPLGLLKTKEFILVDNIPQANTKASINTKWGIAEEIKIEDKDEIYSDYDFYVIDELDEYDGSRVRRHRVYTAHKEDPDCIDAVYVRCVELAFVYDDPDEYLAHVMKNPIWKEMRINKDKRKEWVMDIWNAAHRDINDILRLTGMSQIKMYTYFCIPRRTLQDWCRGISTPPPYLLMMMQEIFGFVKRRE